MTPLRGGGSGGARAKAGAWGLQQPQTATAGPLFQPQLRPSEGLQDRHTKFRERCGWPWEEGLAWPEATSHKSRLGTTCQQRKEEDSEGQLGMTGLMGGQGNKRLCVVVPGRCVELKVAFLGGGGGGSGGGGSAGTDLEVAAA